MLAPDPGTFKTSQTTWKSPMYIVLLLLLGGLAGWLADGPALAAEDRLLAALADSREHDAIVGGAAEPEVKALSARPGIAGTGPVTFHCHHCIHDGQTGGNILRQIKQHSGKPGSVMEFGMIPGFD